MFWIKLPRGLRWTAVLVCVFVRCAIESPSSKGSKVGLSLHVCRISSVYNMILVFNITCFFEQTDSKPIVLPAQTVFLEKAKFAGEACARGEFENAVRLYTEAIELDPENHALFSNRSAAYIRTLHYDRALEDGRKAAELQPHWSKVSRIEVNLRIIWYKLSQEWMNIAFVIYFRYFSVIFILEYAVSPGLHSSDTCLATLLSSSC